MKIRNFISWLLCVLLLAGMLAGCSSKSQDTSAADTAPEAAAEYYLDSGSALGSTGTAAESTALPENRKWIVTVNMTVETEDLDALTAALDEAIAALEGYVEDQELYNGSTYSSRRYRSAYLTVRIPAETVESFTADVAGIANVVSQSTTREDVTLSYVATESRVTALQTEETRLLELMAQAENMSDLLEIETRLTDVRYELESVTSQLRLYDNQIDYATIYLDIEEVQEYTPVEDPTVWERISGGFRSSLIGVKDGAVNLAVWIIANSPYLVLLALAGWLLAVLVIQVRKRRRRKKQDREQKPE